MKIATRLYLGFGLMLLMLVGVALLGIMKVSFIDSTLTRVNDFDSKKQRYAINFRGSVHDRAIAVRDAHTLEVDMPRSMDLNRIFGALDGAGIRVRSMRTKSNRLEELFVRMTGEGAPGPGADVPPAPERTA